jgi:hypothetical protein
VREPERVIFISTTFCVRRYSVPWTDPRRGLGQPATGEMAGLFSPEPRRGLAGKIPGFFREAA